MKKTNYFLRILTILIIIFIALSVALESGYYDVKVGKKATLTEEKLEEFEQDVKDGKEIDIKEYIEEDTIDYSTPVSKFGQTLGSSIDKFMSYGLNDFFNLLSKLF